MTAPNAAFVIRDGVLFVRDWEWRSDDGVLLGMPCASCWYASQTDESRTIDLRLGNGYDITISLYPDEPDHCYAFFTPVGGPPDWTYFHSRNDRHTADELLEMVRDVASRPPHPQEG